MSLKHVLLLSVLVLAFTAPPPGQLFNLNNWILQLPVSNGNGGVEEISNPQLETYTSEYFYTDTDSSMTFWCPQDGAHTSGSNYPRSELRETPDWTVKGTHELNCTCSVTKEPQNHAITIGQIHADGVSGSCSIIVELEWNAGTIVSHLRDKNCNNVQYTVGTGYKVGDKINYYLKLQDGVVTVTTNKGSQPAYTYSWITYQLYFKAGDYVQDNATSSTEGGIVHFYQLDRKHSS